MSIAALLNICTIYKVTGSNLKIIEQLVGFTFAATISGLVAWLMYDWFSFMPLFFRLGFASAPAFFVLIFVAFLLKLVDKNSFRRHNNINKEVL